MMTPRHGSNQPENWSIWTFELGVKHEPV